MIEQSVSNSNSSAINGIYELGLRPKEADSLTERSEKETVKGLSKIAHTRVHAHTHTHTPYIIKA